MLPMYTSIFPGEMHNSITFSGGSGGNIFVTALHHCRSMPVTAGQRGLAEGRVGACQENHPWPRLRVEHRHIPSVQLTSMPTSHLMRLSSVFNLAYGCATLPTNLDCLFAVYKITKSNLSLPYRVVGRERAGRQEREEEETWERGGRGTRPICCEMFKSSPVAVQGCWWHRNVPGADCALRLAARVANPGRDMHSNATYMFWLVNIDSNIVLSHNLRMF